MSHSRMGGPKLGLALTDICELRGPALWCGGAVTVTAVDGTRQKGVPRAVSPAPCSDLTYRRVGAPQGSVPQSAYRIAAGACLTLEWSQTRWSGRLGGIYSQGCERRSCPLRIRPSTQ